MNFKGGEEESLPAAASSTYGGRWGWWRSGRSSHTNTGRRVDSREREKRGQKEDITLKKSTGNRLTSQLTKTAVIFEPLTFCLHIITPTWTCWQMVRLLFFQTRETVDKVTLWTPQHRPSVSIWCASFFSSHWRIASIWQQCALYNCHINTSPRNEECKRLHLPKDASNDKKNELISLLSSLSNAAYILSCLKETLDRMIQVSLTPNPSLHHSAEQLST